MSSKQAARQTEVFLSNKSNSKLGILRAGLTELYPEIL